MIASNGSAPPNPHPHFSIRLPRVYGLFLLFNEQEEGHFELILKARAVKSNDGKTERRKEGRKKERFAVRWEKKKRR